MVILIKTFQVILALSILIFVHEFGHFMWARIFKIRVEKFYLFFDIKGKALARWKWGETEFGIGLLPFGGYCKISGMIDESMDMKQVESEPKSWEFRAHPAWHRMMVIVGGVLNNFIFAVLTYSAIMAIWGSSYIDNRSSSIYVNELAYEMGFRNGDRILKFDDYEPKDFSMLQADLARRDVRKVSVLRGTDTLDLYVDHAMIGQVLNSPMMFDLAVPFIVDSVAADSRNADSGLLKGDKIIAFDGHRVDYLQDSRPILAELKDRSVAASVIRGKDTLDIPVNVDTTGRIGVYMKMPEIKRQQYSIISAIPAGLKLTGETVSGYIKDLKLLVQPETEAYKSVGSFIAIGQVFPETWDWYAFLNIIALLSIMLAVMNLLPIPALDGGHLVFILYEMITGRKPSDKFLAVTQTIGMLIIFALMFLAIGNDLGRIF